MDIKLEKKKGWRAILSKKSLPYIFGLLLLVLIAWMLLKKNTSTLRVNTATIVVSNVEQGEFKEPPREEQVRRAGNAVEGNG